MDAQKIGKVIYYFRKEQGMTQRELAETLHVGAKTVSKWERGQGCPDMSVLRELAEVLNVTVEQILSGELPKQKKDSGNVARMRFYLCPHCGNILMGTGACAPVCCGRRLKPAVAKPMDEAHGLRWERMENDNYFTFSHPQEKSHYLQFAALVNSDRMVFVRLYPEQDSAFRMPWGMKGTLYVGCNTHGLFKMKM